MPVINYDSLLNCLLDLKVRYVPVTRTITNWYRNRNIQYTSLSLEEVRREHKRSDTVFVLGGSESINEITEKQWEHIAEHDSIGMNWWPVHTFIPTYYYTNYPRGEVYFEYFQSVLEKNLKNYTDTVFFINGNRAARRGIHPRVTDRLFPGSPLCCFYRYPEPIRLAEDKMVFTAESFTSTIYYRGGLSLVLDLMNKLRYRNIILMGVDLLNAVHFYDTYPEMQWQFDTGYSRPVDSKRKEQHGTLHTKGNTKLPISEYLYAVNDLYFKPAGVNFFVGSGKSILADRVPAYQFPY